SPAVNYIPAVAPTYAPAPSADFFGNARKTNNFVDAGAVEFAGGPAVPPAAPTLASMSPASGASGSLLVPVALTGTNLTGATAVSVSGTGVSVIGITASATTVRAFFTITAAAAPGARTVTVTTPGGTSNPVTFTVAATSGTLSFTAATNGTLGAVLGVRTLTFTIPSPRAPVTSVVTVTNAGATPLQITEEALTINLGGLYSLTGTTCSFTAPLAPASTCTA